MALPLYDPDNGNSAVVAGTHPRGGNGLIGADPAKPDVVVAANVGSDLIYVPGKSAEITLAQDYVSGLFVDDALGSFPGTLPLSTINLKGSAVTPHLSIVVNFRSYATGCDKPVMCAVMSPIPACSRDRACTAASAAPTP